VRHALTAVKAAVFLSRPVPLIAPRLIVGLGPPRRKHLPCFREVGAGLVEGRRCAAEIFARLRSRIESAAPAPWGMVVRDTGSSRDRADMDVAVIDQPAFFAAVVVAAAGKGGHAPLKRGWYDIGKQLQIAACCSIGPNAAPVARRTCVRHIAGAIKRYFAGCGLFVKMGSILPAMTTRNVPVGTGRAWLPPLPYVANSVLLFASASYRALKAGSFIS
jgi:hypothetical protein